MFVLRSLFWLTGLVMLLPPSTDGAPAPRVSLIHTAYSARILLQDVTGVCERNPEACAASRDAIVLLARKVETGAEIVSAGMEAGQALAAEEPWLGTLTAADLRPDWAVAEARP